MKKLRAVVLISVSGAVWYGAMRLFFVWSGAQTILADPDLQSGKFIRNFTEYSPLPRMRNDPILLWQGFYVCGVTSALVFLWLNRRLSGGWAMRGLKFGIIQWALMAPWFEFYLPYNVMHEPLSLALFEALLWLGVLLTTGVCFSATVNMHRPKKS